MNSDNRNSDNRNSGDWNSGYRNSGDCNSGNHNSGYRNSSDCNSGSWNSGNCNSGDCNSGNRNSGHWNSGYRNSGDYNSGNCNSGCFCESKDPTVMLFDAPSTMTRRQVSEVLPDFKSYLVKLVDGKLIVKTYHEMWAEHWKLCSDKEKQAYLNLPNFDAEKFKRITGIDTTKPTCEGKVVEVDGKRYKLQLVD